MNKIKFFIIVIALSLNSTALASPQQYNNYLQNAYKALKSGNYQTAIQNYKNALLLYPNEANIYNNLGVAYSRINDLNNAERCYKKTIQLEPSNAFVYSNLSGIYERKKQYAEAAKYLEYYAKLSPQDKNIYYNLCEFYAKAGNKDLCLKNGEKYVQIAADKFDIYCVMGNECKKDGDFNKAAYYFGKAISVSNNQQENINLPYALQELRECQFKIRIANIDNVTKAPPALYDLVKTNAVLKYKDDFEKTYEMLDLLWNDEDGRILINEIIEHKIPIQIVFGGKEQTNAYIEETTTNKQIMLGGFFPLYTFGTMQEKNITVNLGENIINMYKSPKSSYHDNMYALMTVMHEMGHAVASLIEDKHKDSLEEEITVSMIGYNSASKILIGRPLTREESIETAKNCYKALMTDDHKNLPMYNNFRNTISKTGVNLYNYDTYSDIYRLQQ